MSTPPKIRLRGIRASIPPGYILGRFDPGGGEVQLISLADLANRLVATGVIASAAVSAQVDPADFMLLTLTPLVFMFDKNGNRIGV